MAKYGINEKWYTLRNSTEDEAQWIVTTAAKFIRDGIREKKHDCKSYPTNIEIKCSSQGSQWILHHLEAFLRTVILSEVKRNSKSSRSRSVITPTLFGVGIEMDHVFLI